MVAVQFGHDVDIDAARHGTAPKSILHPGLFKRFRCRQHVEIGLFEWRVGKHFKVACNLASGLKWGRLQRTNLTTDQFVQEFQISGNAVGSGIFVTVGYFYVLQTMLFAMKPSHLLYEDIVDERDRRGDTISCHSQGRVNTPSGTHDRNVKKVRTSLR